MLNLFIYVGQWSQVSPCAKLTASAVQSLSESTLNISWVESLSSLKKTFDVFVVPLRKIDGGSVKCQLCHL